MIHSDRASFKILLAIILIFNLLLFPMNTKAQNTPGGLSPSYYLKANTTSKMTLVSGAVSAWDTEVASSTYSLIQGTAANRPTFNAGSTDFNFNPSVQFDGINDQLSRNSAFPSDFMGGSTGTLFIVLQHGTTNLTTFTYRNTSAIRYQIKPSFRVQTGVSVSGTNTGYTIDPPSPTEYSTNSASITTIRGAGPTYSINKNSTNYTTISNTGTAYHPSVVSGIFMGANNSTEYNGSDVAELIMFNSALSNADINRVESYLALKYGITRRGNGVGANYIASDGTTIFWTNLNHTGYLNNITGIGRDDVSGLNQKQSKSVNNDSPVTIGLGSIATNNSSNSNTFSSNKSFLTWGDNGGSMQSMSANPASTSNMPAGVEAKIIRVWKTESTSFTQDVTIGIETSYIVSYTPISNLRLLVDDDGSNWSNADVISGAVLNGSRVEFSGINFNTLGKRYFTLATIDTLNTPLPVSLISFTGKNAGTSNILNWTTSSEQSNDYFIIEKLYGDTFKEIAIIDGAFNSNNTLHYTWIDEEIGYGSSYYQLSQVDADGKKTTFNIIAVKNNSADVTIGPNPVQDFLTLYFNKEDKEPVYIEIFNTEGKVVYSEETETQPYGHTLHLGDLAPGFYHISFRYADHLIVKKFIKIPNN